MGVLTRPIVFLSPPPPPLDDFNRADGALGSNWTAVGTAPVIVSNKVQAVGTAAGYSAMWTAQIGDGSQSMFVQATITCNGTDSYMQLRLGESNSVDDEWYAAEFSNLASVNHVVFRKTGGSETSLGGISNVPITTGVPFVARLEWDAGTGDVRTYVNGALIDTDNESGSGVTPSYGGIRCYTDTGTLGTIDNFDAGLL